MAKTKRLSSPGIGMVSAAVGFPNVLASKTRWVPRLGRSFSDESISPAHTPVALMTARADDVERFAGALVGQRDRGAGGLAMPRCRSGSGRRAAPRSARLRRPGGRRRSVVRRRPAGHRRDRRAERPGPGRSRVAPKYVASQAEQIPVCPRSCATRRRPGTRRAPMPGSSGSSTAAAEPAAASPEPDEGRCASSGFRVRPRCAGRCPTLPVAR